MKHRLILLLTAFVLFCSAAHAAEVTIGTGTTYTSYLPYGRGDDYSTTQSIYTASEIGIKGSIKAIAYKVVSSVSRNASIEIYMGHKAESTFKWSSDHMPADQLTLVYSGEQKIGGNTGWETITLTKPFEYDGTSNLVVAVCTANSGTSSQSATYSATRINNVCLDRSDDEDNDEWDINYEYGYSFSYERPDIKLTIDVPDFTIDGVAYKKLTENTAKVIANTYSGVVVVPSTVNYGGTEYTVTHIDDYAFNGCKSLTYIRLNEGLTTIGKSAFEGCSSLSAISIPSSVTSIGTSAFYGCTSLSAISIPSSVTSIGDIAFRDCTSLSAISIPSSVTSIGTSAFSGCTSLSKAEFASIESLVNIKFSHSTSNPLYYAKHLYVDGSEVTDLSIPEGVTSIGSCAFYNCVSFTSISLPESLTSIGSSAFGGCTNFTSISLPESLTSIGSYAFDGCEKLVNVEIPNIDGLWKWKYGSPLRANLQSKHLYINGEEVTSIVIPDDVTEIGAYAFFTCSALTSISIPNSVTKIGDRAFVDCSGLTSITLPKNITIIPTTAFSGCSGLSSINIPDGVTEIKNNAFDGCTSLSSITLPESITRIGTQSFANCSNLRDFTILAETPPSMYSSVFESTPIENCTLHVPANAMEAYKAEYPWENFGAFENSELPLCATPVITIEDGMLIIKSETPGASYHYTLSCQDQATDAASDSGQIALNPSYTISAYATAEGYCRSEVVNKTFSLSQGDLDGNGAINITDVTRLVNMVLKQP